MPTTLGAWAQSPGLAVTFIGAFYVTLTGSKIGVAFLCYGSRKFLKSKGYKVLLRLLGVVLLGYGAFFAYKGYQYIR